MSVRAIVSAGLILVGVAAIGGSAGADDRRSAEERARQAEFFESKIRPIFVEQCSKCHGDAAEKGGLRLDSGANLLKGGDNGAVVVPGDPESSTLIEAVRRVGAIKMPPKSKLPDSALADLERWVREGAYWPESLVTKDLHRNAIRSGHWAFRPIRRTPVPETRGRDWPLTVIDRFVFAELESRGVRPSAPADKRTLIRRATFDLTGLPPTLEEIDDFLKDDSPGAFARVVDRLLASPHYGERWGRLWLDVARYADTKGYVFFEDANFPWSYTYRDYVIRSFNTDLPFDRFIVEQLAADRLDLGDDRRPLAALGFLTLGGRFMNNANDVIDDQIDVVTRGLMGLTVSCARCHDHKFDPIPTRDYYALHGVFASTHEPLVPPLLEPPPRTETYTKFARELSERERKLRDFIAGKHRELVSSSRRRAADYLLAAQSMRDQPTTEDFMLIADGGDLNPSMVVRWQKMLDRTRRSHDPVFAAWHSLARLQSQGFAKEALARIDSWRVAADQSRPINPRLLEALSQSPPSNLSDVAKIYGRLLNWVERLTEDWSARAALDGAPDRPLPDPALEQLRIVFHGPTAPPDVPPPSAGYLELLPDRASQAKLQELVKAVEAWRADGAGAPPRAMILEDSAIPVEPRIFLRGNPNNLGEAVPRRFLSVLSSSSSSGFQNGSGRLELAQAIASSDNPLTARVIVNRVWMHHFGAPLVATPSDFGVRGEPPTHPALLDDLAATFMAEGWSLKRLHRQIILSRVYQQSSEDRAEAKVIDPENRWLWRMNRRRLDLEAARDAVLAVSQQLDRRIGGPSIKDIVGPTSTRRTLYGFIDRLNLANLYRSFDFPDPNTTSPRRDETTIAPQALFWINHPFVSRAASRVLERQELKRLEDRDDRARQLHRLILGRLPDNDEERLARAFLKDASAADSRWRDYVQALLLSNEFAFID
jgi:mono/diheme cytochrome c family protein